MIKEIIKRFVPQPILNWNREVKNLTLLKKWIEQGRPLPTPHLYKQQVILDYRKKYGSSILIETGTYLGDMVEAQKKYFEQVVSIELGPSLYEKARKRFKKDKHVKIFQGDSGKILPSIMKDVDRPAIFWLDGHYSKGITAKGEKECPIFEELRAIFNGSNLHHVLLIDDARCFTGSGDYPTIEEVSDFILQRNNKYSISIKHDIIQAEIPEY
jgi:hypothetical protein